MVAVGGPLESVCAKLAIQAGSRAGPASSQAPGSAVGLRASAPEPSSSSFLLTRTAMPCRARQSLAESAEATAEPALRGLTHNSVKNRGTIALSGGSCRAATHLSFNRYLFFAYAFFSLTISLRSLRSRECPEYVWDPTLLAPLLYYPSGGHQPRKSLDSVRASQEFRLGKVFRPWRGSLPNYFNSTRADFLFSSLIPMLFNPIWE